MILGKERSERKEGQALADAKKGGENPSSNCPPQAHPTSSDERGDIASTVVGGYNHLEASCGEEKEGKGRETKEGGLECSVGKLRWALEAKDGEKKEGEGSAWTCTGDSSMWR